MKKTRVLISSVFIVVVGFILWFLGLITSETFGVVTHQPNPNLPMYVVENAPWYYVGLAMSVIGLIFIIIGIGAFIVWCILQIKSVG